MLWLLAGLLALLVGPLLLRFSRQGRILHAVDGFVVIAIVGLVVIEVLPHAFSVVGGWALGWAALGLLLPERLERLLHRAARRVHAFALVLAMSGLGLHDALDGAALAHGTTDSSLAMAVVLHRLPVGLAVWWLIRPAYGAAKAVFALAFIVVATLIGYVAAGAVESVGDVGALGAFEALVGGSLLHVVLHRGFAVPELRHSERWAALGGAFALGLLLWLLGGAESDAHGHGHDHGAGAALAVLWQLLVESAPALLLAYVLAGVIGVWMPRAGALWLGRGGPTQQALRGVIFGLPIPLCSCGVVPVYRSLIQRGAPPAAALGFFVATPEIGIDAVLLSVPLLGGDLTLARVLAAGAVAVAVGAIVGRNLPSKAPAEAVEPARPPLAVGVRQALKLGLGEVVDATAPWIAFGLLVAAVAHPLLDADALASVPRALQVPLLALVGLPVYVCASGATPLVALMLAHGATPGAALAFLLTGPATNVTTFGLLKDLHGGKVALRFGVVVAAMAISAGYLVDAFWPANAPHSVLDLHDDPGPMGVIFAVALIALFAASVFRLGPRGFLTAVLPAVSGSGHDHASHDGHGHGGDHSHDHVSHDGGDHGHDHGAQHHHVHEQDGGHGHHDDGGHTTRGPIAVEAPDVH